MRMLFPGVRLGNCLRHALTKLPKKLVAIASPVCKILRLRFPTVDVHCISSLPVTQGTVSKAWVDNKPVQMVWAQVQGGVVHGSEFCPVAAP